ncbi:MAG: hypothetical protein ACOYMB_04160 [Patescibacteria group bacterium]
MKIFKGWFFYLISAVVLVLVATLVSNYYATPGEKKPADVDLLSNIPSLDIDLSINKKSILPAKVVSSSTAQKITDSAKEAAKKVVVEAPERLQFTGGVKGTIFRYLREKKLFFEKNNFYFVEGADKKWDFGFQGAKNKVKLFSLKP